MTVHFIGAGPGAPDLLTLRGRDLIAASPVCLYAGSLFLRMKHLQPAEPGALAIAAGVAGFLALGATGWLGGKLVYVHGIGKSNAR